VRHGAMTRWRLDKGAVRRGQAMARRPWRLGRVRVRVSTVEWRRRFEFECLGEAAERSGRVRATQDPGGHPSFVEHSGWVVDSLVRGEVVVLGCLVSGASG
jgi:hypothetical protein